MNVNTYKYTDDNIVIAVSIERNNERVARIFGEKGAIKRQRADKQHVDDYMQDIAYDLGCEDFEIVPHGTYRRMFKNITYYKIH